MSGIAKPSVNGLSSEIIPQIITSSVNSGTNASGLFDGTTPNEWDTTHVCYWNNKSNFIEVLIPNKCNIWRTGTPTYKNYTATLQILKYNGTSYDDVTSLYSQVVTSIDNTQWEKTIANLSAGQYRFVGLGTGGSAGSGYRIDSEWYVEKINYYLIKDNNSILYTYDGTNIIESPSQTIDIDNFNSNGFDNPTIISEEIWNNIFPDKTGLQLLMYTDDTTKTEATIEYNVPEYRPIDKLEDQFQIKKYIPN